MNNIQVFKNDEFGKLRTVVLNGEPWMVGKDVAAALGYSNTKDALLSHVDNEDKRIFQRSEIATFENHISKSVLPVNFVSADIPNRGLTIINESGLYSLILSSKLPSANKFKRWVTSEVLPSIRNYGAYMTPEVIDQVLCNPDTIIKLATMLKDEREKRVALEAENEAMKPKALFADSVASSSTTILVGETAKILKQNGIKIGQNRFFNWLRANGYLIGGNRSDYNMPTQRSMELELFEVKETNIMHGDGSVTISITPKVTTKGQQYFVELFLGKNNELAKV